MVILERGLPESVPSASMALTMSIPSTTSPKTTCLPSNHEVTTVVMKNWDPLVLGPALAEERSPGLVCLSLKLREERTRSASLPLVQGGSDSLLVGELLSVDGLATGAVVAGEISSLVRIESLAGALKRSSHRATHLEHEVGDHAVEAGGGVAVTVLSSAELAEVALERGKDFSLGIDRGRKGGDERQSWGRRHRTGHKEHRVSSACLTEHGEGGDAQA